MASSFDQLLGAAGDVRELEYISALHQTTTEEVRRDASIKAEDISRFLMSRYGIRVTEDGVRDTILQGLGGGGDGDDVLDLMEVVAMLLIPIFLKAARSDGLLDNETTRRDDDPVTLFAAAEVAKPHVASTGTSRMEMGDNSLFPVPPGLIDFVLKMILHDVTGDRSPKKLDGDLIRRILISHGENDLANNDELVEEMLEAATSFDAAPRGATDPENRVLDAVTFATALTYDIQLYDVYNETRVTTNFDDVYITQDRIAEQEEQMFATANTSAELVRQDRRIQSNRSRLECSEKLDRVNTVPFIDTTAGTYRSKGLLVTLWATILITYFAYNPLTQKIDELEICEDDFAYVYNAPWAANSEAIGCETLSSILTWIVFFFGMSVFGLICVYIGSIGNEAGAKQIWKPLVSCVFVFLVVTLPFLLRKGDATQNGVLYFASLLFGLLTCLFCLVRASELFFTESQLNNFKSYLPQFDHPIFRNTVSEERIVKQATARKLSQMTKNALKINKLKNPDSIINSHYGQALKSYETESRNPKNVVPAGGLWWTWKQLLSRNSDLAKVGIWVPARMISSNLAQYVVAVYIIIAGIHQTRRVEQEYTVEWAKLQVGSYIDRAFIGAADGEVVNQTMANVTAMFGEVLSSAQENGTDLGCQNFNTTSFIQDHCRFDSYPECDTGLSYLCVFADPTAMQSLDATKRLALLDASGIQSKILRDAATDAAYQAVDELYPTEKYMVTVPMYIATVIAFIVALSLAVIYIPSVMTTVLRLRNGHIATLRNKDFNRYREAPDQVALLTGSLFWGSLLSSLLVGSSIGLIVFFFLWQATAYYAQRLFATIVGITSVALLRLAIVCTCRCTLWKSFYRTKPGAANIGILALEWGNFALAAGYILARSLKLLLAAMTFIGRIDTPFLAHNVGRIGPLELDGYPIVHMKDVLTHEAHRHPYIEQLGVIYLYKLRYRKFFGKRAGTCWRMIFVYALMPWLHRFRIMARRDKPTTVNDEEDSTNETPLSQQFVSLRRMNTNLAGDGEQDSSQAQTEAMWTIRANLMRDNEAFYRARNQELEQEVERLRVSLAEARSLASHDPNTSLSALQPMAPPTQSGLPGYPPESHADSFPRSNGEFGL